MDNIVSSYDEIEFQRHFRLQRSTFEKLLQVIAPLLCINQSRTGRPQVDPQKQLLAVLWILATPDSYRSIGLKFGMAKSTLSVCFMRVIKALCNIAPTIIKWPQGADVGKSKESFKKLSNIPNVIGVIDGSYIPIKAPKDHPEVYINRKCFHAITLQGICDSSLKFIDCFIGYPSSISDARIFRNSDIYRDIMSNPRHFFPQDEFILGDKAYPVMEWLIPPYVDRGNLTRIQRQFNFQVSQTRQVIERAFALLKGRFRRLKYLDMNRTDLIPVTVLAACVLHNLCIDNDFFIEQYINEGLEVQDNADIVEDDHLQNQENGYEKRNNLAHQLYFARNI